MKYEKIIKGQFISRPNRFIAEVKLNQSGEIARVHVKNTGRCRELLQPGATVYLEDFTHRMGTRKMTYSLIGVEKMLPDGQRLMINMDSQAPNAAAKEWLLSGGLGEITELKPECTWGDSRFDFSFQKEGKRCFLEVKGVTLETDGVCAFPDAPTTRGVKHLLELTRLVQEGCGAYVLFVIQMEDVQYLHPNDRTDPAFSQALRQAAQTGVQVLAMDCAVSVDTMRIRKPVAVRL